MKRVVTKDSELVVMLGGGHGAHAVIRGMKDIYFPEQLSSLAPVSDSGGSSGRFREECAVPAYGDIGMHVKAFANLAGVEPELRMLLPHRSRERGGSFIENMSWSNYTIHSFFRLYADNIQMAIDAMRRLFHVKSRIRPICTAADVQLRALLSDGTELIGEGPIDTRSIDDPRIIQSASLVPRPHIFSGAAELIRNADKIVICPGDFWTSIVPITLVDGFQDAIRYATVLRKNRPPARIILVLNLMTKKNETHGWTTADFVSRMCDHLGVDKVDTVIYNDEPIAQASLEKYEKEHAYPVRYVDPMRAKKLSPGALVQYDDDSVRHHSLRTAELIKLA